MVDALDGALDEVTGEASEAARPAEVAGLAVAPAVAPDP
jgi:hypothetical protein